VLDSRYRAHSAGIASKLNDLARCKGVITASGLMAGFTKERGFYPGAMERLGCLGPLSGPIGREADVPGPRLLRGTPLWGRNEGRGGGGITTACHVSCCYWVIC
jgi:hypothetical protein